VDDDIPYPVLLPLPEVPIWSLHSAFRSVNDIWRVFHPASYEFAVLSSRFNILVLFGPGLRGFLGVSMPRPVSAIPSLIYRSSTY
jgi:hypothetical protein